MKYLFRIILLILSCSFLSCSSDDKDDPSSLLKVDMGKSSSILIPAPATTLSCEQIATGATSSGAISGSYFTLPNPIISWTGETTSNANDALSEIRIVVMKFTLKSPKVGGEYSCVFSDLALGALFFKQTIGETVTFKSWDGKLGRNSFAKVLSTRQLTTEADSDGKVYTPCDVKCGGVSVPKNASQFSVTGEYELIAVQKKFKTTAADSEYEEFPIKVTGSFTVDNTLK